MPGDGASPITVSTGESDPTDQSLVREIEGLRAEIARLRGLLGLDDRSSDGHSQVWVPTLLEEPTDRATVDRSSTAAEKVGLFRSLFGARSDVYAYRWESTSSGKAGWSPATKDRWSKGRPPKHHLPLTDDVFVSHLRGDATIGIYPLLRNDTCALLACDFDKGTWALDALAYLDACHRNSVPAALERSRSGNGAHVWVFFDAPVAASAARAMGAALLRQAMTARAELDLSSYDRFFPSQDFLPKAGFGNLIALPLHGSSTAKGTTVFLDPTTMEPWPDQWAFLSSVARMSPQRRGVTGRDTATRRRRTDAVVGRAGPRRRTGAASAGARSARRRVVDRTARPPARRDRRAEASRVGREPGVPREAAPCGSRPGTHPGSSAPTEKTSSGSTYPEG